MHILKWVRGSKYYYTRKRKYTLKQQRIKAEWVRMGEVNFKHCIDHASQIIYKGTVFKKFLNSNSTQTKAYNKLLENKVKST